MFDNVSRRHGGPLYTVKQAAQYLGVSPNTLRNWDRLGKLKAVRHPMNRYRLYARRQLDAVLSKLKGR